MSHRYGSRMLPLEILKDEFENIRNHLTHIEFVYQSDYLNIKTSNLLDYCYKLDENQVPNVYRLLDINAIVPGFDYEV